MRQLLMDRINHVISEYTTRGQTDFQHEKVKRKKDLFQRRNAEIVKVEASGMVREIKEQPDDTSSVLYDVHYKYLVKQGSFFYLEEEVENRRAVYYDGHLYDDGEVPVTVDELSSLDDPPAHNEEDRVSYQYDRLSAVQYAEKWWNTYNPAYRKFENDCTNFISQCLHAGNAPMRGYPSQGKGWWMRGNSWSYSWTVANSMRLHLPASTIGLRAREVGSPHKLKLGDVICYDFEGDGRFDHTTIVTGRDADGMPLVNAHTFNSRMRYWKYEDSTAYTPNIKYKFYTIIDDR
ncbi:amidase domain-containing protein [Rossellomorea aquimaris]|uniref:amidase domain-containing protein n=1 Tax=Rossellomorea aquimaris TaxID=189382 RepID=UPI001CD2F4E4|nr:amidase domain-containing protein [Rossellomorea aquimaris]MCA1056582.1 amidase domain-containing protein [Rossellomorea aquimaris]